MNFKRPGRRDNLWCVIVLLVPMVFAGARYLESEREMNQVAQAQAQRVQQAQAAQRQSAVRVATAGEGR